MPKRALTPILGREDVIERVHAELESGARIVTLTGPPGIGKTRTARACMERRNRDERESWFCDLSLVDSESGLAFAVLSFLRGRFDGEHAADADVHTHVAEALEAIGPALLVLDNFEQIIEAASSIERWLSAAPKLSVIVTSRERLAIDGEVVIELAPLTCPPSDDADAIAQSPAAQLFLKRAKDAGGTHDDAKSVAAIVRRLEGIPLAIELAAARTRLMSLRDLADRLAAGSDVLARRGDSRHATLANAIAWSWGLLSKSEQVALARCSVFAGSFTLEAAEGVVGGPDATMLLAALRDKSLLHADADGRLSLYVSIRDYAAARLREIEPHGAHTRMMHARAFGHMARLFNEWRQMQGRTPNASVSATLRKEKQNLTAALATLHEAAHAQGEDVAALRADLACAAAQLHAMSGEACLAELTYALEHLSPASAAHRALLLVSRQSVFAALGRYEEALEDLRAIENDHDTPSELQHLARVYRGIQLRHYGFPREALVEHEAARVALEKTDSRRVLAMNEACMGRLLFDLGDFDGSRDFNGRAITFAETMGDSWLGALALANLAQLEQEIQNFPRAEELLVDALARLRDVGEIYEAIYSSACGDLFFEWEKFDVARRWYAEGARFFRGSFVTHRQAALAIASSAALEAHDGDHVRARALLDASHRIASRAKNRVVEAGVHLHGASVELLGTTDRARTIAKWTETLARYADARTDLGEVVATSFEARFALRIAQRTLRIATGASSSLPALVRIDRHGDWFEIERGARVDLRRRGALRRILLALVANRSQAHAGIKQIELAEIGWPGERVLADAAATRVRVAIATLRQLGLRSVLVTRDDGYALDSAARIEQV